MYPYQFFEKTGFKVFLLIIPSFFVPSLLVPILRGYEIWNLNIQLIILFSMIIFCSIGLFLNWKFGLKRYNAYN